MAATDLNNNLEYTMLLRQMELNNNTIISAGLNSETRIFTFSYIDDKDQVHYCNIPAIGHSLAISKVLDYIRECQ